MLINVLKCLAAACAILISGTSRAADGRPFIRQIGNVTMPEQDVTPMVGMGAWGAELGAKGSLRMTNNGFVPMINNSVNAELSVFLSNLGDGAVFALGPLLRWDFHVHPVWTAYVTGGLEIIFPTGASDQRKGVYGRPDAAIGAIWHADPSWDLRGEIDVAHDSARIGLVVPL